MNKLDENESKLKSHRERFLHLLWPLPDPEVRDESALQRRLSQEIALVVISKDAIVG